MGLATLYRSSIIKICTGDLSGTPDNISLYIIPNSNSDVSQGIYCKSNSRSSTKRYRLSRFYKIQVLHRCTDRPPKGWQAHENRIQIPSNKACKRHVSELSPAYTPRTVWSELPAVQMRNSPDRYSPGPVQSKFHIGVGPVHKFWVLVRNQSRLEQTVRPSSVIVRLNLSPSRSVHRFMGAATISMMRLLTLSQLSKITYSYTKFTLQASSYNEP